MPQSSHLPLPTDLQEVTSDWLTAALQRHDPDAVVTDFETVKVMHSTTTKVWLKLQLNDAARRSGIPENVVLKGGFEPQSRTLAQMHWREVIGYRDIMGPLGLPSPKFWFADWDEDRAQGIIIMEDLSDRGVTFCNALHPHTHEQVRRRLSELARFHAQSWGGPGSGRFEPPKTWGELPEFFEVMQPFVDDKSSEQNWERFLAMPRGASVSKVFKDRDWLLRSWTDLKRFSLQQPQCILHGDVHLGNLFIDQDGTPGFFDTLASWGPGLMEVTYHVSAALDIADRRKCEGALVQHYLDELARNGVSPPHYEEAMRQYAIFLLYGHFIWMTTEPMWQTESVNTANTARVSAAMIDHDTIGQYRSLRSALR